VELISAYEIEDPSEFSAASTEPANFEFLYYNVERNIESANWYVLDCWKSNTTAEHDSRVNFRFMF